MPKEFLSCCTVRWFVGNHSPSSAAPTLNFHQALLEPGSWPHLATFLEATSEDEGILRKTGNRRSPFHLHLSFL